jgi:hypothetical protein
MVMNDKYTRIWKKTVMVFAENISVSRVAGNRIEIRTGYLWDFFRV